MGRSHTIEPYISLDDFRKLIKAQRINKNYSLQDVAEKAGINRNTLKQIEDGVIIEPGLAKSLEILATLDLTLWTLLKKPAIEAEVDYLMSQIQNAICLDVDSKMTLCESIRKAVLHYQVTHVLVVDDQEIALEGIRALLMKNNYIVGTAHSYDSTVEILPKFNPDVMLIDIDLKEDKDGLDILHYVKTHTPQIECIMMSMHKNKDKAVASLDQGAFDYYDKDDDDTRLLHAIKRIERSKQG